VNRAHSPGPWAAGASTDRVYPHQIKDSEGTQVARAVLVADARLIAAAPELLAALQAIMAGVAGCQREPHWEAARAAIAKATGEAQS
jgi:hypothetical protein